MSPVPAIGIDLGTTFSCAAVYRDGKAEIIPNKDGDRLTPSIVYFDPHSGDVSVGNIADDMLPQYPKNGLIDVKRIIGRKYDDESISRYINSKETLFSLVKGDNDQAVFELDIKGEKVRKTPAQVSAEILKYLKETASDFLNGNVTEAVITVPAYFSNSQRKATKEAAELAGLKVLKLVTEPTAAAVHYITDKRKKNSNILVFDLGGGTLDVSLINIKNKTFQVKAVYGDTLLGGRNVDEILFEYFRKQILQTNTKSAVNKTSLRRLSNMCINLKKKLSTKDEFSMVLDCFQGDKDYCLSMTRKKFEDLADEVFERCLNVVKLCLNDAGVSQSQIDEIVLVGGSTRIMKIREMLKNYFNGKQLKLDLHPDEAVAAGASIQAALLKKSFRNLEKYSITEVTPLTLGIGTKGNLMMSFIPKNSPLPISATEKVFTVENDQDTMCFQIYEGERKNITFNNKLGEFQLTGLPLKRAGKVIVKISFELDEDGILNIRAYEKSSDRSTSISVTMGQFCLNERRIQHTVEEAFRHKREDEIFEEFTLTRCELDEDCKKIIYDIDKIASYPDRNFVLDKCNDFLNFSSNLHFFDIVRLEAEFLNMIRSIEKILRENQMNGLKYLSTTGGLLRNPKKESSSNDTNERFSLWSNSRQSTRSKGHFFNRKK